MRSMRQALAATAIVLCGLFGAATLGYAAYLVSRDSVGLPVTKLETPQNLAPAGSTTTRQKPKVKPKPKTVAQIPPPAPATTVESGDDHGGGSGKGSGGGGHGGDD
jgi:hypothetical protein